MVEIPAAAPAATKSARTLRTAMQDAPDLSGLRIERAGQGIRLSGLLRDDSTPRRIVHPFELELCREDDWKLDLRIGRAHDASDDVEFSITSQVLRPD